MATKSKSKTVSPLETAEIVRVYQVQGTSEKIAQEDDASDANDIISGCRPSGLLNNDVDSSYFHMVNTGDTGDNQRVDLLWHQRLQLQLQRQHEQQLQVIAYAPNQLQSQQYVLVPSCQLSSITSDILTSGTGNETAYLAPVHHLSQQYDTQDISSHQPFYILQPHQQHGSPALLQAVRPRISDAPALIHAQSPLNHLNCHVANNKCAPTAIAQDTTQYQLDLQMRRLNYHNRALQQHVRQLQRELQQGQHTRCSQAYTPTPAAGCTTHMLPPQHFVVDSQEVLSQQDMMSSRLQQLNQNVNHVSAKNIVDRDLSYLPALSMQPLSAQCHPSFTTANQQTMLTSQSAQTAILKYGHLWSQVQSQLLQTPANTRYMCPDNEYMTFADGLYQSRPIPVMTATSSNATLRSHDDGAINQSNAQKQKQHNRLAKGNTTCEAQSTASCEVASDTSELKNVKLKQQNCPKKRKATKMKSAKGNNDYTSDNDASDDDSMELERPKRPMTAYNFFFKAERARMLGINDVDESIGSLTMKAEGPVSTPYRSRAKRCVPHYKISFEDMAKSIGMKWKVLDAESVAVCQSKADVEKIRYRNEKACWLAKKKRKQSKGHKKKEKKLNL